MLDTALQPLVEKRLPCCPPHVQQEISAGVAKDLGTLDSIVLPIAFVVLMFAIRSLRLLGITMSCLGLSFTLSYATAYAIAEHIVILQFVPSFMMTLLTALSIDYSLFMLTVYR